MQPLEHNEGAIGVGTQVSVSGMRGLATGMAATAEASALVPAGIDEVSLQAALAFATEALEANAINALAQQELSRTGLAYVEAAGSYNDVDVSNAATLL